MDGTVAHVVIEPSDVLIALTTQQYQGIVLEVGMDVGSFECGDCVDLYGLTRVDPRWQTWQEAVRVVRVPLAEYNLFPHR